MNILYTTNDKFVSKIGASICSVFENNKDTDDITIYIIGQKLTSSSKDNFRLLAKQYKRKISIIDMENLSLYFDFDFDTLGWDSVVLARLVLDRLLPESVDKILYLDGDTINICGLTDLWNTDLNGKVLGACIEATIDSKRREELGMKNIPYINSGVLLIDLKKWREEKIGERIIRFYRESGGNLFAPDQDAINGALKQDIYYLPPKYNFYNIYWFYPYKYLKKLMKQTPYYSPEEYEESMRHPTIIHYLGEERPWRKGNRHRFKAYFKKYLNKTPWKDEPEEEGWEFYFICWNIFNLLTRPFPALRYNIINGLIPFFMKWRKKQLKKQKDR